MPERRHSDRLWQGAVDRKQGARVRVRSVAGHLQEYDLQVVNTALGLAAVRQLPSVADHEHVLTVSQGKFNRQPQPATALFSDNQFHPEADSIVYTSAFDRNAVRAPGFPGRQPYARQCALAAVHVEL